MDETIHALSARLAFNGDIIDVLNQVANDYSLGHLKRYDLLTTGYQDYNVRLLTTSGEYVVKIFAKDRTVADAHRYTSVMLAVLEQGVQHPDLYRDDKGLTMHTDGASGLMMVVMAFLSGTTFYDAKLIPASGDLSKIMAEVIKIHCIDLKPSFVFDEWAIPNIRWMHDQTAKFLDEEGRRLVEAVLSAYDVLPINALSTCFVHGDIIKSSALKAEDGKVFILDFAVANVYPKIQELAVMAANLLFSNAVTLEERIRAVMLAYEKAGGTLTGVEKRSLCAYSAAAAAMEFMGGYYSNYVLNDSSKEIDYWKQIGLVGLREAVQSGKMPAG